MRKEVGGKSRQCSALVLSHENSVVLPLVYIPQSFHAWYCCVSISSLLRDLSLEVPAKTSAYSRHYSRTRAQLMPPSLNVGSHFCLLRLNCGAPRIPFADAECDCHEPLPFTCCSALSYLILIVAIMSYVLEGKLLLVWQLYHYDAP